MSYVIGGETEEGQPVQLGNWEHAETYASALIEVFNHWIIGWMEMSMVMNISGGPSDGNKSSDASIIVNITANEFYKQPTYYITAHFSKFLLQGTRRIGLVSHDDKGIQSVAFKTPENSVIIVLLNKKLKYTR
ncbi:lysosomal acid glucosylceramidase isoform X2 [Anabrus simplex]|uniref:lysosomal acid glucosylceramidase isoform X2 n=1 Tax=Anabrus simplex TaxID=316456 RepID=UPI0035A30991